VDIARTDSKHDGTAVPGGERGGREIEPSRNVESKQSKSRERSKQQEVQNIPKRLGRSGVHRILGDKKEYMKEYGTERGC
jgi:hypothetical protein